MTTGERIRYYRKLNNMTMVELAQKIGVQHSAIYKYETGKVTNIPIGNINKMAYVFGVPARELVDWMSDDPSDCFYVSNDEKKLIALYRRLTEENRNSIRSIMQGLILTQAEEKKANTVS